MSNGNGTNTDFIICGSATKCYNGQCIGSRCACTFGYLADDCSESWRDPRYYYTYQCWHWTLTALFAISSILVIWRLTVVIHSKLKRLALPRASGHMAVCRARCNTLFDTQTNVLFLVLIGSLAHTMQFADPWTIEGVLTLNSQLFVGNVAVTASMLGLSLWIRFFAGVHARFDANTKRALRALDTFIFISCTVFGALIVWQFINIFAIPSYELLSTLTVIYTAMAAIFVVVLVIASIIYAVTTLRFVVTGTGTNSNAPLSAGQLAAQRLAHTLRMIQGLCVVEIIIVVVGWIIDPYNSNAWFAMGFLALYRGLMLLAYVGILPVMGKAKPPGATAGGGGRASQIGSQLVIAGSPNAAAAAAAAAFMAAGRSPRYQALQISSPDVEPIGSPMSPKKTPNSQTAANLWKVAAQSSHNLRRVSPIVTPLQVPLSARHTTVTNNTPSPLANGALLSEAQITTVVISPRTLSPPATAMGHSSNGNTGATATASPRSPGGPASPIVASPRHTPRNGSLTVKQSPYGALQAQVTNKRASGAYRTSASLQSAASLSLNNNDHMNGSNGTGNNSGITPTATAMSHHAHTTMARDLYTNRHPNASHTPASSSGGSNTSNGVYIVTTPPSPSVPAPLPMPPERVASLTSVDIVTSSIPLATHGGHHHSHGNGYHMYTIHQDGMDDSHDHDDSTSVATATTVASPIAAAIPSTTTIGSNGMNHTVSPPRALRLGTFVDVRTLEPNDSDTINL